MIKNLILKSKRVKKKVVKNTSIHFTIYIEDMDRAKRFYSNLFSWDFDNSNSGHFLQIKNRNDSQHIGTFQSKKHNPLSEKPISFECSIEVEDIDNTILTVVYNGGIIITPKTEISNVGYLIKFLDTENNIVTAIQYYEK